MPRKKTAKQANGNGFAGTTHIACILDKSGSMEDVRHETITGFNDYLATLQADPAAERMRLTLTLFDTSCQTPITAEPVGKVNKLDATRYVPGGFTALHDAVSQTVRAAESKVADGDRVLVVIITDGQENSSRDATKAQVQELIARLEAKGNWTFTYLSASPDAFADAHGIGVQAGNVAAYVGNSVGTRAAFRSAALNTSAYVSLDSASSRSFYSGVTGRIGADQPDPLPGPSVIPPGPARPRSTPWTTSDSTPRSVATTPWLNQ